MGFAYFTEYPTVPLESDRGSDQHGHDRTQQKAGRHQSAQQGSDWTDAIYLIGSTMMSTELGEIVMSSQQVVPESDFRHALRRPERSQSLLLPQRSLQLRAQGNSDHLLLRRRARRLSPRR